VFEEKELGRKFGPKRKEKVGGWGKLHNEELHDLYTAPNITKVIKSRTVRWAEHATLMEKMRNVYNISVGKPERKRSLRRPRHRWEDNIRTDLRETEWEDVDWIHLAQERDKRWALVKTVMNLRVTSSF
jgi:hypothetical protein